MTLWRFLAVRWSIFRTRRQVDREARRLGVIR